jgi:ketosteroid isomerase-like protein
MDTRATIESLLDAAYAARQRQDHEAAAAYFTEDGCFKENGGLGTGNRAEQHMALKATFEQFELLAFTEHCRIVDPPRAVVHWRGTFRAQNGQVGDTDILDLIEVRDGRISSLTTFFDTAYAAALGARPAAR